LLIAAHQIDWITTLTGPMSLFAPEPFYEPPWATPSGDDLAPVVVLPDFYKPFWLDIPGNELGRQSCNLGTASPIKLGHLDHRVRIQPGLGQPSH
jgi:hypothetical protein